MHSPIIVVMIAHRNTHLLFGGASELTQNERNTSSCKEASMLILYSSKIICLVTITIKLQLHAGRGGGWDAIPSNTRSRHHNDQTLLLPTWMNNKLEPWSDERGNSMGDDGLLLLEHEGEEYLPTHHRQLASGNDACPMMYTTYTAKYLHVPWEAQRFSLSNLTCFDPSSS